MHLVYNNKLYANSRLARLSAQTSFSVALIPNRIKILYQTQKVNIIGLTGLQILIFE